MMKIVDVEAIPFRIPLKHPFKIALGTLTHSNHVLVRMTSDSGHVGWGECTTFHSVYGYDQKSLYDVLTRYLIPAVMGCDPRDLGELHRKMDLAIPFNLMAKCGIDLAAWDLIGKARNLPVHRLFRVTGEADTAGSEETGARKWDGDIPVTAAVGIDSPAHTAQMARQLVEAGFQTVKVKIGLDPEADLARVQKVREVIGDQIHLRVDANQGYDRASALAVLEKMEPLGLEWIEQPLPDWDLDGHAMLADRLETPIALDESVYTIHDAVAAIKKKAADVVNLKLPKCGGIHRAREIAAYCREHGVPCFLGGCIETTPGTAAQAHFYVSTRNIVSAAEMEGPACYVDDVACQPMGIVNGRMTIPEGPGFGVELDLEKIERYRVRY